MSTIAARRAAIMAAKPAPSLDLRFTDGGGLDPRITFTRAAGPATYFDATGTMQTAGTNVARFDYDPVTHAPRGLLIEEARTNIVVNSATLATWITNQTSVDTANVALPDGTLGGIFLRETTSVGGTHSVNPPFATVAGTTYCISIFAKAGTRSFLSFNGMGLGGAGLVPNWDLSTGTDVSTGTSGTFAHGIQAVGNGWYRCWMFYTAINTGGSSIIIAPAAGSAATIYAGDNVSGLYLWGGQVEIATFPTSYIPTSGAAATRAADVATMPVGNWFNAAAGTLGSEAVFAGAKPSAFPRIIQFDDGTGTNGTNIGHVVNTDASAPPGGLVYSTSFIASAVGWQLQVPGAYSAGVLFKMATSFAPGAQAFSLNGGTCLTSSQASLPPGLTTVRLGAQATGPSPSAVYIRRVRYWPRALGNAELQAATR